MKGVSREIIYFVVIMLVVALFLAVSFKYFRDLAEEFADKIMSLIKVLIRG